MLRESLVFVFFLKGFFFIIFDSILFYFLNLILLLGLMIFFKWIIKII